jgi:hypothetical protein
MHSRIQSSPGYENAVNFLEVTANPTVPGSVSLKITFKGTSGPLYGTKLAIQGVNVANQFGIGTDIPWISKMSCTPPTYNIKPQDRYVAYVIDGHPLPPDFAATFPQCSLSYLKLPAEKPAHLYLSSTTLMWPDGGDPNFGWWASGYKPVMTPAPSWYTGGSQIVDVMNLEDCNNPLIPQPFVTPTSDNMQPSKIMGWYGTEFKFYPYANFPIRRLGQTIMNYFWAARPDVGQMIYAHVQNEFQNHLNTYGGFVAVTEMTYRPNWNQPLVSDGSYCYSTSCGDICNYVTRYIVEGKLHHYTVQKLTPAELTAFYDVIHP